MSLTESATDLAKRYTYCYDGYYRYRCNYSAWDNWVRWVVLAVILVIFFFFFILLSCLSARRRRRRGMRPFYGTGWAAHNYNPPTYQQSQQQPYYTPHNQGGAYYNPPPNYGGQPQQPGQHPEQGYYAGRDVELQQPQQAYTGPPPNAPGGQDFAPPPGPPPHKG